MTRTTTGTILSVSPGSPSYIKLSVVNKSSETIRINSALEAKAIKLTGRKVQLTIDDNRVERIEEI